MVPYISWMKSWQLLSIISSGWARASVMSDKGILETAHFSMTDLVIGIHEQTNLDPRQASTSSNMQKGEIRNINGDIPNNSRNLMKHS